MRNVVLLTFDSLRADHCSFAGYDRETTPTLDRLAEDGVTYTNAIAPASRTNPSMAGALTGEPMVVRDRVANPAHSRRHLARHGTVAEALSSRGYATGAFCPNAYASRYYGFDRGFETFEDFLFSSGLYQRLFDRHMAGSNLLATLRNLRNLVRRQEAFKTWDSYVDDVEAWAAGQEEPFFLWVFSLDTHFPYLTPRGARRWSSLVDQYYGNWRCNRLIDDLDPTLSARDRGRIVDLYDDAIRYADRFVAELADRLEPYDPVFVVHGDHGEAFCEHGVYGHFYPSLYEENVHVPLVVAGEGVPAATVEDPVSLVDLPAIVEACVEGTVEPGAVGRAYAVATDYDGRTRRELTAARTRSRKYLVTASDDGGEHHEAYDLAADPGERENLVDGATGDAPLEAIVRRRRQHERELLAIRAAADGLEGHRPTAAPTEPAD